MKSHAFKLISGAAATLALTMGQQASALNIALTNDDGWSTYGIHALYNALTMAGHNVTLAGPLEGESGSSGAINLGNLAITKQAEDIYSVATEEGGSAEPATSGLIAMDISMQANAAQPDLLISGINDGANLGPSAQISGTVGAAIAALGRMLGESVPAIAISTNDRCAEGTSGEDQVVPAPEDIPEECMEVAQFIVDLVDELEMLPHYKNGKSGLLPPETGLNINFPADAPLGIKLVQQGHLPYIAQLGGFAALEFKCLEDCVDMEIGETNPGGRTGIISINEDDIKGADTTAFAEGYVTIVPIEANYTALPKNTLGVIGNLMKFTKKYY